MNEVSKSELKAKMFEYLRRVESSGDPLIVKDYGEPVLIIQPLKRKLSLKDAFKDLVGTASLEDEAILSSEEADWTDLP